MKATSSNSSNYSETIHTWSHRLFSMLNIMIIGAVVYVVVTASRFQCMFEREGEPGLIRTLSTIPTWVHVSYLTFATLMTTTNVMKQSPTFILLLKEAIFFILIALLIALYIATRFPALRLLTAQNM